MAIDPTTGRTVARILIVEPDRQLQRELKEMLSPLGQITLASDGQEGLELLRGGLKADVVVAERNMPRLDGLALAKSVKRDPKIASPFVILGDSDGPMDTVAAKNAGASHYVARPFRPAVLVDRVKTTLR